MIVEYPKDMEDTTIDKNSRFFLPPRPDQPTQIQLQQASRLHLLHETPPIDLLPQYS